MLAAIHDDTWNVLNMQHTTHIWKNGIIQTSQVMAIKRLKDTWLKVATSLEKSPPTIHNVSKMQWLAYPKTFRE